MKLTIKTDDVPRTVAALAGHHVGDTVTVKNGDTVETELP